MRTPLAIAALLAGMVTAPLPAAASPTYTNPVSAGAVDTFPDPTMIHAKDGLWYAYGTQNPVFNSKGEDGERILPILRSKDMVTWEYAGEVFTPQTQPAWHDGARLWAPDIRYINGTYYLYYSVSPKGGDLGLATAPTPAGPWTDKGGILPAATRATCPTGHIDSAQFTDVDGAHYMYWGSYDVVCVARMNADATRVEGAATQVARGRRMEGAYVVRRGGHYYMLYSDGGCCQGSFSGYQVKAGRATSPFGPFTDDEGAGLMDLTSKGAIVAGANGNRWTGTGHSGFQTDLSGQDWLVYHGVSTDDPDFPPIGGGRLTNLSKRPLLIDRLDWIAGWPVVRAGAGPSEGAQPAPVTSFDAGGTLNEGLTGWRAEGGWSHKTEQDAKGYATHAGHGDSFLVSARRTASADVRAQADLRVTSGKAGLALAHVNRRNHVVAWLDRNRKALVTDVVIGGRSRGASVTALPAGFDFGVWHNVVAELRGTKLTVQVSAGRLGDPVAEQTRSVPRAAARRGAVGAVARGTADADNAGAARLYTPVTERVPEREPGEPLPAHSDEFDGTSVGEPWQWVRGQAAGVTVSGGVLSWPTQNAELFRDTNTASVLLRDAPEGDYTVEAKLRFAPAQGNQQAGILLYENDDRYFKLAHSALPLSRGDGAVLRMSEFAKEGERPTATPPISDANGAMFGGPAAETMWLRLSYHHDTANDESEVRAATSRDGEHWVRNGVWTLPAKDQLRIGLFSMNKAGAVAGFDYVRTYRH
ncbi:arabinan endo-1,5-alpha-L-arabinosidase [Nonomuraea sp. KC401]|uniref:family 43 glycosylhydrolase n=1 Tax=unclassified Nonomuraea TaxID=2593643 RepID=UPI0010FEB944|nr:MULTISPECIES: family 43 glycosylhydrolase [unclassified Nonomuraea]NBE95577.1 family 43 glycosylhydrolase [Nonomuraea sp. K271]TLF70843.1 arabinan endo-1,5-alpha-L-arabinosidase [Nonomuraea sp. KC401]